MCTFGLSGCGVKPRWLRGRRGFTQQPENSKRAHLRPRRFKHNQNSTRKPPEREERMRFPVGERKKSAKFWAPHPATPTLRGPTLRSWFGQSRPIKVGQSRFGQSRSNKGGQIFLAKVGLAKVGIGQSRQIRMAKVGLAKVGLSRPSTSVLLGDSDTFCRLLRHRSKTYMMNHLLISCSACFLTSSAMPGCMLSQVQHVSPGLCILRIFCIEHDL